MLSDNFEEMGVGYHYLANDPGSLNYRHYWTQVVRHRGLDSPLLA